MTSSTSTPKMLENVLDSLCAVFIKDDGMNRGFDRFIAKYRSVLEWLVENNTQPHMTANSYHNTRHLVGVGFLTYWMTHNHPATVLAALIHDFHYANASPDAVNIAHSVLQADKLGFFTLPQVKAEVRRVIVDAVKSTEYDFSHPFPDIENPYHRLLRDADQLYSTVFFDEVLYQGLEAEVGPKVHMSGPEFLSRNALYVANNRFYSDFATDIRDRYLTECLIRHVRCCRLYTLPHDNESTNHATLE